MSPRPLRRVRPADPRPPRRGWVLRSAAAVLAWACAVGPLAVPALAQTGTDPAFQQLLAEVTEFRTEENPLPVPEGTDPRYGRRLSAPTEGHFQERAARAHAFLDRLEVFDAGELSREERVDAAVLGLYLRDEVADAGFRRYLFRVSDRSGFHIQVSNLVDSLRDRSVDEYDAYIGRLQSVAEHFRLQIDLLRRGVEAGLVHPASVMAGFEETIQPFLVEDPRRSAFFRPLAELPARLPADERERILRDGEEAIRTSVLPAYRELFAFVTDEYLPAARSSEGWSDLPGGREHYEHKVRHFTTLELSAREVHEIGLREVARIREEMEEIIRSLEYPGTFREFLDFLRTDPRFYVEEPGDYIREAAWIAKRMDGELPRLFRTLPATPYGLRPIPDVIAPRTTGAYYSIGDPERHRAGFYFLNLSEISSRPLYVLEALTFHEAVPGHHLQIMLHRENPRISEFRDRYGITAFVEGWALYAERLGREVGFFTDPYSDFGRLTYEIWRACRLVVDTGIHALGWSRQQAIDYMADNTALSLHEITTEVNRYVVGPGQALAYKMGELRISELRRRSEEALGDAFDVREFHHAVLRGGSLPLSILEQEIGDWLQETRKVRTGF